MKVTDIYKNSIGYTVVLGTIVGAGYGLAEMPLPYIILTATFGALLFFIIGNAVYWMAYPIVRYVKKKRHPFVINDQALIKKPSRNQPCPCGSGRKFKKCCGR